MEKLLRTLQSDVPFLLDAKFAARSFVGRALKRPHDADFRALSLFPDIDGALYLDVGANRGQSTEAMLMLMRRSCIWAFEPNPLLSEKLARQFGREERVVVRNFGLGDQEGTFNLFVPYYKKWMYDGLASLKREAAADWLRDRIYWYQEKHLTIREVECRIRRLDDLALSPFFIKLDVQGYELEALRGGERTLRSHEPILLIESPDDEVLKHLTARGYRPYRYEAGQLRRDAFGEVNTFFMTDGKAALLK